MESSLSLSPRDDYNRCVEEYEENSQKCSEKCSHFFACDKQYKDLQVALYKLLTTGDETWENIQRSARGSEEQKEYIASLQHSVEDMYTNLHLQEKAIANVDDAMRRAVRRLEKTKENVEGLVEQVRAVRRNLSERVSHMTKLEPALTQKRSSKQSSKKSRSGSPTRERTRGESDNGHETRRAHGECGEKSGLRSGR